MRLSSMMIVAQLALAILVLVVGITSITALREAADGFQGMTDQLESGSTVTQQQLNEASELVRRTRGSAGLVAIVTGVGFFALLLFGGKVHQKFIKPLARMSRDTEAISIGRFNRRVATTDGVGELGHLGTQINNLADQLQQSQAARSPESLLARAGIEHLLDDQEKPGGLLTPKGLLIASNSRLRKHLHEGGIEPAVLLERSEGGATAPGTTIRDVRDGGVLRGYLVSLDRL